MTILQIETNRIVCWFSCGAASAVATKIAVDTCPPDKELKIVYCDTGGEHPDNMRFLKQCEIWFNHPITILKSKRYNDIFDVWDQTRYLVGVKGARCTVEMKKKVRDDFQEVDDLQIFGFTSEEKKRAARFVSQSPDVITKFPLIENNITKSECLWTIAEAGIEIPEMYKLGYQNNNCIGCVKGQSGYWNKIRIDFPDVFDAMALRERKLNVAINKSYAGDGKRKRVFLDELDPNTGRYDSEPDIACGVVCSGLELNT